jgi:hypothetical protein
LAPCLQKPGPKGGLHDFSTRPQHPLKFIPYIPKFVNLNFKRLFAALVDFIFVFGQKTAQKHPTHFGLKFEQIATTHKPDNMFAARYA